MVQIEFSFGEINHDLIHMTNDEGEFVELNDDYKDPNSFWGGSESIQFSVEFSEVEEFIEEIKIQMDMINYTGCKLIIKKLDLGTCQHRHCLQNKGRGRFYTSGAKPTKRFDRTLRGFLK